MNNRSLANLALSENGFLFDAVSGNIFTLNQTAMTIMKGIIDELSPEQISTGLSEDFDVSYEAAAGDVHLFIRHLVEMHVIPDPEFRN